MYVGNQLSHRRVYVAFGSLFVLLSLLLNACAAAPSLRRSVRHVPTGMPPAVRKSTTMAGLARVRHVFVIMLENEGYDSAFADPSQDPYLAKTLVRRGALLENYYAVGHSSLDNYIAFISGQPPNPDTQGDCVDGFVTFARQAHLIAWKGATDIQEGSGCVYPPEVQTLVGQLAEHGFTWKAYMQDMGNQPGRDGTVGSTCGHPALNGPDRAIDAAKGDGYVTRHDPFVYFQSIIDNIASCDHHVVPLGSPAGTMPKSDTVGVTGLASDLRSASSTPNFSFISPNLCEDGHDYPCGNEPTPGPSALADIDGFLKVWVPLITASPAFKANGLLLITFDEGTSQSACCGEVPGPTNSAPGGNGGPGGGRVGAVLLSPFIKPGTVVATPLNHYSALASFEDLFGLPRLGDAQTVTTTFDRLSTSR
jgi:hypothetical protein